MHLSVLQMQRIMESATVTNTMSAVSLRIDTNTVQIVTDQGQFLLTVKQGDTQLGSKRFDFYRSGTYLLPTHPSSVESWLRQFEGQADSISFDYDGLVLDSSAGGEYVSTSLVSGGATMATSTTYVPRRNLGGGHCDGSLCYDPK